MHVECIIHVYYCICISMVVFSQGGIPPPLWFWASPPPGGQKISFPGWKKIPPAPTIINLGRGDRNRNTKHVNDHKKANEQKKGYQLFTGEIFLPPVVQSQGGGKFQKYALPPLPPLVLVTNTTLCISAYI
jgi:hypothetical protein